MKDVIIIGTGEHAKVIADIVQNSKDNLIGFLSDEYDRKKMYIDKPVLGDVGDYKRYENCHFIIAIGNADIRERIASQMQDAKWYTAIHPSAIISSMNTSIGAGSVVMANTVINPCAQIKNHCIINTGAIIEHDNLIEDFVHISVGAKLAGAVKIHRKTWVGIGVTVNNGLEICENCMIGAGAVVVRNIEISGTYVGVPAKKMK